MEGPMALYRRRVAEGALDADPAQRLAIEKLQLLWMRLKDYNPARPKRVPVPAHADAVDQLAPRLALAPPAHHGDVVARGDECRRLTSNPGILRKAVVAEEHQHAPASHLARLSARCPATTDR